MSLPASRRFPLMALDHRDLPPPLELLPCPAGSVIDMPDIADVIRRPRMHYGALHGAACPLCQAFFWDQPRGGEQYATPRALADAWTALLETVATRDDSTGRRCRMILAREGAVERVAPRALPQDSTPAVPPNAPHAAEQMLLLNG